jgi:hypothetical protein
MISTACHSEDDACQHRACLNISWQDVFARTGFLLISHIESFLFVIVSYIYALLSVILYYCIDFAEREIWKVLRRRWGSNCQREMRLRW